MPPFADVLQWEHLPFPKSLRDFQRLFKDDAACAAYLEGAKWPKGFVCPHCHEKGEPFRIATRPTILQCRKCRRQTGLMQGTVMQDTKTPLTVWFWAAYLVSSMTPGMSAVQFQRQLGLSRYETAFNILHKLRAGMVRQGRDRIGGNLGRGDHVEIDETYIGGVVRGEGKGPHADDKTLVVAAVEVRTRPAKKGDKPMRRGGRYAGRLRLEIAPTRGAKSLTAFVEAAVEPGAMVITVTGSPVKALLGDLSSLELSSPQAVNASSRAALAATAREADLMCMFFTPGRRTRLSGRWGVTT